MTERGPIRSLHVVASLDRAFGGSAQAPLTICRYLSRQGHPCTLLATVGPDDDTDYLQDLRAEFAIHLFPRSRAPHYFHAPSLRQWLLEHVASFDLVDVHGVFSFPPLYASSAASRFGVPYLVRPHGSLDPFDLGKHSHFKRIYGPIVVRRMLRKSAGVVLTSPLEAERLVTYGARPAKESLPLPVETSSTDGDGSAFRANYNIPVGALVVLSLGRIDYKKGLDLLIPALSELKHDFPSLWFVLAGRGENNYVDYIRKLLHDADVSSWTTECGFLGGATKQSAFLASDLFVLPSLNENFGIVIVEAMRAGLPLLVSDEVYLHTVLGEAGAAAVCNADTRSVRDALASLLSDPARRLRMSKASREIAERMFSPERAIESLVAYYRQALVRVGSGAIVR